MNCPPPILEVIGGILTDSLLRARAAGWAGDAEQAALEADHVHNLPYLLKDYRPELLDFYWNTSRVCFTEDCAKVGVSVASFQPWWDTLATYVNAPSASVLAK